MGFLSWSISGGLVGFFASLVKGKVVDIGRPANIIVGIIGGIVGGLLMNLMLHTASVIASNIPSIFFAALIALIVVACVRTIKSNAFRKQKAQEQAEKEAAIREAEMRGTNI